MQDAENHPLQPPLWYTEFRRQVRNNPEKAAQKWANWTQLERIDTVWIATKKVHLDLMEWSLLSTDGNENRWIDVNSLRDEDGCTLLHDIGSNSNITLVKMLAAFKLLVEKVGCNPDVRDREGKTPLHCVCGSHVKRNQRGRQKYIKLLRILVNAGVDVNCEFKKITPLHLVHESPWAMKYLIKEAGARADVEDTFQRPPFIWTLRNPHVPAIRRIPVSLFQNRMDFRTSDFMGHSFIHYAVLRAHADNLDDIGRLIGRLIAAGADVNHRNRRLRTPLFFLISKPDLRKLAVLLLDKYGADVNLCDADGYSVVHMAAILGRLDYVALFLPYLKTNVRTRNGETVRSCLQRYCGGPLTVTDEVERLLIQMEERKGCVSVDYAYPEPYTIWEYVHLLDRFRDLLALYIVDTFHRYRGGRWLFSDIFHHITHSTAVKLRAQDFLTRFSSWRGSSRSLLNIIDEYSVVIPKENKRRNSEASIITYHVRQTVKKLMEQIRLVDAKTTQYGWLLDIISVGSVVDGSKILLPDEYDFLIVFRKFYPGSRVPVGEDYVAQVEQFRLHLIHCMQLMDAEMTNQNPSPPFSFEFVDSEMRRVCLNIRLTWWGAKTSHLYGMPISVDMTPVFQFVGWENQSGLRPLRPLYLLPNWFKRDQEVEHFRPLHNWVTNQPCAATMEVRCLSHPSHRLLQYCLRLLKLVIQCQNIVQDDPTLNSHFLKLALFCYVQEQGLPTKRRDVTRYVYDICSRLKDSVWKRRIPSFVADALVTSPAMTLRTDLLSVLDRKDLSCFVHDCTLL